MGDPHISHVPKLEHDIVLRGIKKEQSKNAKAASKPASKPRLPMIPTILLQLRKKDPSNYDHTRDRFVTRVRSALSKAGLYLNLFAGHSFRIGAATVAHMKGIEDSTIMTLGRWKSNAYQRYVRIPQEHLTRISSHIATPTLQRNVQVFHPLLAHVYTC